MKSWILVCISTLFTIVSVANAQTNSYQLEAYKHILRIPSLQISQPTAAQLTLPISDEYNSIMILENESLTSQPIATKIEKANPTNFSVSAPYGNQTSLTDNNPDTFVDFPISENGSNESTIMLLFEETTVISGIDLTFADYSRLPTLIRIATSINGQEQIILNQSQYNGSTIRFPQTSVASLMVYVTYSQPIRLTKVSVIEEGKPTEDRKLVRFLAKPNKTYTAYFNKDRVAYAQTEPAGNLFSELNPVEITIPAQLTPNPSYVPSDLDEDGIPDSKDNCPSVSNIDQSDVNENGIGDMCDDTDYDYVINSEDNCPEDANSNQRDVDGDNIGDVCDDQESRFTEQHPWLPWAAMGGTAVVISALVFQMSRSSQLKQPLDKDPAEPPAEKL